jgi:hypothetical protein
MKPTAPMQLRKRDIARLAWCQNGLSPFPGHALLPSGPGHGLCSARTIGLIVRHVEEGFIAGGHASRVL